MCIRLIYAGQVVNTRKILQEIASGFSQFNIDEINSFILNISYSSNTALKMITGRKTSYPMILSVEELAGLLHLPDISLKIPELEKTSFTAIQASRTYDKGIIIGKTITGNRIIRLPHKILQRHTLIIGRTGSGKTTFAFNILKELIESGQGVGVLDPHGDLLDQVLNIIPRERIEDTVLIDPADTDYPVAFNPLKISGRKDQIVSAVVDAMRKIFADFWGPQTDYLLRQTVSTLIECPDETILSISRILRDENCRKKCLKNLTDPVLIDFWKNEYKLFKRSQNNPITPILNKTGRFMEPIMRNILGQKENLVDLRKIIDGSQILLINLAKGILGEENSLLLGNFFLAHIQLAVLSRAELPPKDRTKFYLSVDELQNFLARSTDSSSSLFTESRKYGLGMIGICQHLSQLGSMADTVFGNVNTIVSFGVGPKDAKIISEYFREVCSEDLLNLPSYHAYIRMIHDVPQVFSFKNIPPPDNETQSYKKEIIKYSREKYAKPRKEVEEEINKYYRPKSSHPIPDTCKN